MVDLWCLTLLSAIFQLYRSGHFYWWRKLEYPEKTTNLPQVTDKLSHNVVACHWQTISHNVVSSTPYLSEIWTHNVSVDRHILHRYVLFPLPYNHHHFGVYICKLDKYLNSVTFQHLISKLYCVFFFSINSTQYTVKVLLFVDTNFRSFCKMHWSMGSWIHGLKHYSQKSMGKLYFVRFLFSWFMWTAKIRTPRLKIISQYI